MLAPLTALAAALRADREGALAGLGGMYIQGVAEVDPTLGTLRASPHAAKMRDDMDAAKVTDPKQPSREGDRRRRALSVLLTPACVTRPHPLARGSSACRARHRCGKELVGVRPLFSFSSVCEASLSTPSAFKDGLLVAATNVVVAEKGGGGSS